MPALRHKRGTRAALNVLAGAAQIVPGQIYLITDESNRIAVGLTPSTYQAENRLVSSSTQPTGAQPGDIWIQI